MFDRRNEFGVVFRKAFSPEKLKTRNLDGKVVPDLHWCCSCKQYLPYSHFYTESESKKKTQEQARNMCLPCWDDKKGRVKPKSEAGSTLEQFIED